MGIKTMRRRDSTTPFPSPTRRGAEARRSSSWCRLPAKGASLLSGCAAAAAALCTSAALFRYSRSLYIITLRSISNDKVQRSLPASRCATSSRMLCACVCVRVYTQQLSDGDDASFRYNLLIYHKRISAARSLCVLFCLAFLLFCLVWSASAPASTPTPASARR